MRATIVIAALLLALPASAQVAKDTPGARDLPALKRFDGTFLVNRLDTNFDDVKLAIGKFGEDGKPSATKAVEGKATRLVYQAPKTNNTLELSRNYRDSITAGGGEILFDCKEADCGTGNGAPFRNWIYPKEKMAGPERDTTNCVLAYGADSAFGPGMNEVRYFAAKLGGAGERYVAVLTYKIVAPYYCTTYNGYHTVVVQVIEPKPMGDSMITVKAADMAVAISSQGRIALYGIYFDTDKAVVKPESDPTLAEISTLLKNDPKLRLLVVGHTDSTGDFDHNTVLSRQRAVAVAQVLAAKFGIAANRLRAEGVGMLAPAASNDSEDGRAKNRRVELVKLN